MCKNIFSDIRIYAFQQLTTVNFNIFPKKKKKGIIQCILYGYSVSLTFRLIKICQPHFTSNYEVQNEFLILESHYIPRLIYEL